MSSSSLMMDVDERKVEANIKPEYIVSSSSVYDPIKSEETDDEDMHNTNTSTQSINIKEEGDVKVKAEEDISTDDEQSPEYVVSSSSGYNQVKSEEETDEEQDDEDTNTINQPIKIECNEETGDDVISADDNDNSERKELERRWKSLRLLANPTTQPKYCSKRKRQVEESIVGKEPLRRRKSPRSLSNQATHSRATNQEHGNTKRSTKKRTYCSKRKREVEEINGSVQKAIRGICSVEGCTGKAADSGTCKTKHKGYDHCKHDGCTNRVRQGGVCIRHGAKQEKRKICSHEGCDKQVQNRGVCYRHGAKVKTCSHDGCTNNAQKGGVCIKHGAAITRKTCNHDGCTKYVQKGGFCRGHYNEP